MDRMTEREAFIAAVAANPEDDTARLAFADWLQEHGEDARAEFVRLQCAIAARKPWPGDDPYELYDRVPEPDEARARDLLMNHLHEWFGPLFGAVGMAPPGPAVAPTHQLGGWGWRFPPYSLASRGLAPLHRVPLVCVPEPRRRRGRRRATAAPEPQFLNSLDLDRGFVTGLHAAPAHATPRCSLGAALRLEPVTKLDLTLPPDFDRWARFSDPLLARVRELELTVGGASGASGPIDFSAATGAILNDPALGGVRSLALLVQDEYDEDGEIPAQLTRAEAEAVLSSSVVRGLHSLRAGVAPDGATAFATAEPLPDLRALSLDCRGPGPGPVALPLHSYRDRLEQLTLSEWFDATALGGDRPWARLAELNLHGPPLTAAGCAALAAPATFPALARLQFTVSDAGAVRALADALRAGRFPHLIALAIAGHLRGSAVALAEAVAPTGIRELDLRRVWDHSEADYTRVCELLGARVRIQSPADRDAIPF